MYLFGRVSDRLLRQSIVRCRPGYNINNIIIILLPLAVELALRLRDGAARPPRGAQVGARPAAASVELVCPSVRREVGRCNYHHPHHHHYHHHHDGDNNNNDNNDDDDNNNNDGHAPAAASVDRRSEWRCNYHHHNHHHHHHHCRNDNDNGTHHSASAPAARSIDGVSQLSE